MLLLPESDRVYSYEHLFYIYVRKKKKKHFGKKIVTIFNLLKERRLERGSY